MIRQFSILLLAVLLSSCAKNESILAVNKFHLRDTKVEGRGSAMVRGEQRRRLYGAVTKEEQEARLGEYFTVRWNLKGAASGGETSGPGETVVVLKYQQAKTASKILKMSQTYKDGQLKGVCEFHVKGDNYHQNGRVLAWRVELLRAGKVVASQQSYMWE